jgi:hypothetical protein
MEGSGLIVMLEKVAVVNTVDPAEPDTDTPHTMGVLTTSAVGMANEIMRVAPTATTPVDLVWTAAPFPGGGVIVTVTPVLAIAPAGKLVPETVTVVLELAAAGVVVAERTTCPLRLGARPRSATAPATRLM